MENEQEIKNLIDKTLEDYTQKNAYGPSLIPAHTHNGVDSARIDPINLLGFPSTKVTTATTAPTDNPFNGTIRYYYDSTPNYVQWTPVGGIWVGTLLGTSASGIYELLANKSTNTSLGVSNTLYPTQNAVLTYITNTSEALANKSTTTSLGTSNTLYPTQNAVKVYADTKMVNPMTTGGDLIYGGASGVATRLANGSSGQVLTSAGGTSAPSWATNSAGAKNSGNFTYNSGVATQNVPHGLGTTPTMVILLWDCIFTGGNDAWVNGKGSYVGSVNSNTSHKLTAVNPVGGINVDTTTYIITAADGSGSVKIQANISAMDATNFTINWSTFATGVAYAEWIAFA